MLTKKELKKMLKEYLEVRDLDILNITTFTQMYECDLNFSCNYVETDQDYYTTAGFETVIKDGDKKIFLHTVFDWDATNNMNIDERISIEKAVDIIYYLQERSTYIQSLIK